MKYTRTLLLLLVPLLYVSRATSQTSDWKAVQALPSGTKIKVTLKDRPTFGHCFLDGVSDTQLACSFRTRLRTRDRVFLRDDIKAVFLVHSGPMIGLAVGAGAGAALGASRAPIPGLGRGGTALVDAGILGGVGAFFGLVLDPFFHGRAVYRSPQDPSKNPTSPPAPNAQEIRSSQNAPACLRDGATLQCVH
jgi:hypothetical protein